MAVWTRRHLNRLTWRAIMFGDGAQGLATQIHECVELPALWRTTHRENRQEPFEVTLTYGAPEEDIEFEDPDLLIDYLNDNAIPNPVRVKPKTPTRVGKGKK